MFYTKKNPMRLTLAQICFSLIVCSPPANALRVSNDRFADLRPEFKHDTFAESVLVAILPSFNATHNPHISRTMKGTSVGAAFSMAETGQPAQAAAWKLEPPFDGPTPVGYNPMIWWIGLAIAIVLPSAIHYYAYNNNPPTPTKVPSWVPNRLFEQDWTERQCYVLWITCVQWFFVAFACQIDFNPGWSIYVSKVMGLNAAEIGVVLSTGPMSAGLGIVISVCAIRHFTVGQLMLYTLPYTMITNCFYAAFRTTTCMAVAHFCMSLFFVTEFICALNRLSRIIDRENIPKCMGFVLSFYIAGSFAGTVLMPLALSWDYNLPFIIGNLCQAFVSYNAWINFRTEESAPQDALDETEKRNLKSLGLYQSKTNIKMLAIISSMYFLKSAAVAVTQPTFFPYLDGVIGPLSPVVVSAIRGVEIIVQATMHVVVGELLNGNSQHTLLMALCWGFVFLGVGHLFYEPSAKLFIFFPQLRVDIHGNLLPAAVWTCGVFIAQFLTALGNTIIGIAILPVTQSFFATDNAFLVESIAPAIYNFCSNEGGFVGNLVGGLLTQLLSFGQANEIIALGILLVGLFAPLAFHMHKATANSIKGK